MIDSERQARQASDHELSVVREQWVQSEAELATAQAALQGSAAEISQSIDEMIGTLPYMKSHCAMRAAMNLQSATRGHFGRSLFRCNVVSS